MVPTAPPELARRDPEPPSLRLLAAETPRTLILIPCLNEGPRIADIVTEVLSLHPQFDVLIVDDGSGDDTAKAAEASGAGVVRLPLHLGFGSALLLAVVAMICMGLIAGFMGAQIESFFRH